MSRPESPHVTALKAFRERLVDSRRAAVQGADLDIAVQKFTQIEAALALLDTAIENELDLTPLPSVDDPTVPPPRI